MKHLSTALLLVAGLAACKKKATEPPPPSQTTQNPATATPKKPTFGGIDRQKFNNLAVQLNLPVYWKADANNNGEIEADEVAALAFYPTSETWKDKDGLNQAFADAFVQIVGVSHAEPKSGDPQAQRHNLVISDLEAGRPTLVYSDFSQAPANEKQFVEHMRNVAIHIDKIYDKQTGAVQLAEKVPANDKASQSLFRRNRGPKCVGPATEKDPLCSALPDFAKPNVDVYPASIKVGNKTLAQHDDGFCEALDKLKDAATLITPFTVLRDQGGTLSAVSYAEAYRDEMTAVATELEAAAKALADDAGEAALRDYLTAAANSFRSNDWLLADEAWAKMNAENSKWYVRVGPDEVYWEPCARKAGFHLTFAKINQGSLEWQKKLVPAQQEMEKAIAERAGKPYQERQVTFHLPDFIDIIVNAGDDRDPLGATIGQSLPNWGPVANEGRGRTVAMSNLYQDPDSISARKSQAESILDTASMGPYKATADAGLLSTILHEATHNLGPAHEYKVNGKSDDAIFGGPLASVFEELKAQTGALYLVDLLKQKGIISDEQAIATYTDCVVWAMGHISQGMYTGDGNRKTYGNVAAIQIGFLLDQGALVWDDSKPAANGSDKGALTVVPEKLLPAIAEMMKVVGGIKARGDVKAATQLAKLYVDGTKVPHKIISERFLRFPKASFVYSVNM